MCAYFSDDDHWLKRNKVNGDKSKHGPLNYYLVIIAFAPFWWRFAQCMNKARSNKMQYFNALKYISKVGPIIAVLCGAEKKATDKDGNPSAAFMWYFYT